MRRESFSFSKLCKLNNYKLVQGDGAPTEFENSAVNLFLQNRKCSVMRKNDHSISPRAAIKVHNSVRLET